MAPRAYENLDLCALSLKSVLKAREHSILHPERIFGNAEVSGNPSALHPHGPETGFAEISSKPTSGPNNFRVARHPPKIGLQFELYRAF
jgi:hypothetical protein